MRLRQFAGRQPIFARGRVAAGRGGSVASWRRSAGSASSGSRSRYRCGQESPRRRAWWDRAERELGEVVEGLGLPCEIQPGAGAIYGPKLEFVLRDRRDRPWQCGTIQLDFVMPQRFDVRYVDPAGEKRHVVMLHRALYGSIERRSSSAPRRSAAGCGTRPIRSRGGPGVG
jgi:hypothetical protein